MPPSPTLAQELETALTLAAERLQIGGLPAVLVERMAGLAEQVRQPFVLAVVGRIKAGKSSLVNGLLGLDLPTVGVTETTATVNWFRHGPRGDEGRVYCYCRGETTPEIHPIAYLDRLQGDSPEILELVAGIDRLEFRLPIDWLRPLTLVDTPGLNAVTHEHQNRAASFMGLASQLRKRNEDETVRLSREADAVLYVLNPAPKESDLSLLEEFQRTSRGADSAFNSVAVLGKMDYHDVDTEKWDGYAEKVARAFLRVAARVVSVSVAVDRLARRVAADETLRSSFTRMADSTTDVEFEDLLDSDLNFETREGLALPRDERQRLRQATEWTALIASARAVRGGLPIGALAEIGGLSRIRRVIEEVFVAQGPLLRCQRIARDAEALLVDPIAGGAASVLRLAGADHARKAETGRYLALLDRIGLTLLPQDRRVAESLRQFLIAERDGPVRADSARTTLAQASRSIAACRRKIDLMVIALASAQLLEEVSTFLSSEEVEELRLLFARFQSEDRACGAGSRQALADLSRGSHWRSRNHLDDRIQLLFERAAVLYSNSSIR